MRLDLSVPDALGAVLATARQTEPETVPLADALGRTLAERVLAPEAIPPFDTSAMDGYAVRAEDCAHAPLALPVAGSSMAGAAPSGPLAPGTAMPIATGAPLPSGADAIVPVEWTERADASQDERVQISRAPEAGRYIRRAGSALAVGDAPLASGVAVTPAAIGMLAAMGLGSVRVRQRPRVRLVVTGDEVAGPGAPLAPGQIRDINGPALAAQIDAAGAEVCEIVQADDASGSVAQAARGDADLLLLTGGVSVGPRDRVLADLSASGVVWHFWRVRQRPGKPLLFGTWDGVPVLALPGNPVSASVGFEVYGRPLIAAMLGRASGAEPINARLGEDLATARGLHTFARVFARRDSCGQLVLTSAGPQGSHVYRTLLGDGLAHLPADWDLAPEGSVVPYSPFAWTPTC
ncbi:gephyrin-like molybdotransferase Glp [Rubricoccus marinus]|uniref:Molybdopterin molybdenumtransferase n=1 Tax=Rubricoccus marinus TaxID=716817 RepID=A0A259TYT3_9BACT|nr:gephyrin-like molybdotransferase Glp [Rubricoccus marinus]OZC02935.1 hypothetical protein BSZ36_08085 [Rubricoccus marinus]